MSITTGPGEDALALLAHVDGLLDKLRTAPLWRLGNAQTLELGKAATVVTAKVASLRLAAVREVDTRGTATADGASSTAAWLRGHCLERPGAAKRTVALSRALSERYRAVGEDLAAGLVSADHASVVVRLLDALPDEVDEPTMAAAETDLLARARTMDPTDLAKVGRRLKYVLDPDGAAELAAEEARMFAGRSVSLTQDDAGWWHLRGKLDPETGHELSAVLDPLCKPRPSTADGSDLRTAGQRRADGLAAMVALAHASPKLPSSGGERPTVLVQIPYATLLTGLGAAGTYPDGTPVSPQTARRLACDAKIIPMVMGSESQPLDVGRTAYTPTATQRRAVMVRDQHKCRTPHCGNHPRHVHHIRHWMDGGPTDLDNLVALCGHCHRLVHSTNNPWTITPTPGGAPVFTRTGPAP